MIEHQLRLLTRQCLLRFLITNLITQWNGAWAHSLRFYTATPTKVTTEGQQVKNQYSTITDFVRELPVEVSTVAICGTSYTDTGGIARVIEQQAMELNDHGYSVEIYTLIAKKDPPDGVSIHQFGRFSTTPYKEFDKLLSPVTPTGWQFLLATRETDLIVAHRFPFSVMSYFASIINNSEYVFWSHPSHSSDNLFSGIAKIWAKFQHHLETKNFAVRQADYICGVSQESANYIRSQTGRDTISVPNTVPDSRFTSVAPQQEIELEYGINPEDTVVLHVGRITPRKNIHELVDSFEHVINCFDSESDENVGKSEQNGYKLVLVGRENMNEYSETVRDSAGENVIFTGFIDDEELAGLYRRSDVYATCSLSEGWGLPLSEASNFDTTIVAYDSIPAANNIQEAKLAQSGDLADFRNKLRSAIETTTEK
jgi:1,2-diacylglycerol 3-alpha-glucosyltransferase